MTGGLAGEDLLRPGEHERGREVHDHEFATIVRSKGRLHRLAKSRRSREIVGVRVLKGPKHRARLHQLFDGFDDRGAGQVAKAGEGQAGYDGARIGTAGVLTELEGVFGAAHDEIHVGEFMAQKLDEFGFALDSKVGSGFGHAALDLPGEGAGARTEFKHIVAFGERQIAEHGARKSWRTGGDGSNAAGIANEMANEVPGEGKIDAAVFAF